LDWIMQNSVSYFITIFSRRYHNWYKCCNTSPRWICICPPVPEQEWRLSTRFQISMIS
jgi:hypothetical protein